MIAENNYTAKSNTHNEFKQRIKIPFDLQATPDMNRYVWLLPQRINNLQINDSSAQLNQEISPLK